MNELVSVVIPTYNREKMIIRSIESVLNQTYEAIEVCVIDDASTDNTEKIVQEKYRDNDRVIYYRLAKNGGACVARNTGVSIAHGKYIAFLDSDDKFAPQKIELQMLKLKQCEADICVSDYKYTDRNKNEKIVHAVPKEGKQLYYSLLYCNSVTTGIILGKKECFEYVQFDPAMPRYQDWDLALRLSQKYRFCYVEEALMEQEFQTFSITSSTGHKKTLFALDRLYKKNRIGFKKCNEAFVQIHWLMGMHSIFTEEKTRYDDLWIGVSGSGFRITRFWVYILTRLNCKSIIEWCYRKCSLLSK